MRTAVLFLALFAASCTRTTEGRLYIVTATNDVKPLAGAEVYLVSLDAIMATAESIHRSRLHARAELVTESRMLQSDKLTKRFDATVALIKQKSIATFLTNHEGRFIVESPPERSVLFHVYKTVHERAIFWSHTGDVVELNSKVTLLHHMYGQDEHDRNMLRLSREIEALGGRRRDVTEYMGLWREVNDNDLATVFEHKPKLASP